MIYLFFSILVSSFLYVVFKLFGRFKINTLHAIVINYYVAFFFGLVISPFTIPVTEVIESSWFYGTLFLGILFIVIFNIMAITAQRSGMAVTSVATKMSVVLPVSFGIFIYGESAGIIKLTGIVLALVAVYLVSIKSKEGVKVRNIIFPLLLFIGSGIIDTSLKYFEMYYVEENHIPIFSTSIFGFAGFFGSLFMLFKRDFKIKWKSLLGGIALGIPNYFSIYFILKALSDQILESSAVFTINNVSIVMLSTLIGLLIFRERLLIKNWIGIALAIVSIFLVIYT